MEDLNSETWYVDTGCSNHMSSNKSSRVNLNKNFKSVEKFGNESSVEVMGIGDVRNKTRNEFVETIANVFYIPELKTNLLSAGQLEDKGYTITIKNRECEIYDPKRGSMVIVKMKQNRLFPMKIKTMQRCLLTMEDDEDS